MVTLSGTGSTWTNHGNLYVGNSGSGTVTQTGGINAVSGTLSLGANSTGQGTYDLNGGVLAVQALSKGNGTASFNFGGGTLQASSDFTTTLPMTLTDIGGDAKLDTAGHTVGFSGILSGEGGLGKLGMGTLTLSSANSYTGTTTVNAGTLNVTGTLANNGSDKVYVATNGASFGGTILWNVGIGASYAGFGSKAMGGSSLGSMADLLSGTNTDTVKSLSMQWREQNATDMNALLVSDVLNLRGMTNGDNQTDLFTLQMSYSPNALLGGADAEGFLANAGAIFLVSYDTTLHLWENAVLDNIGINDVEFMGVASTPDGVLGHYGVNTTTHTAWAVLDHNSYFAVVPEPSSIVLLSIGAASLIGYAWRLRERTIFWDIPGIFRGDIPGDIGDIPGIFRGHNTYSGS